MCLSRLARVFTIYILSLGIVVAVMGCGQKRGSGKKKSSDSTGGGITAKRPTAGMDSVVKTPAGLFRVDFLGFTQSKDAKQRVVRLALRNGTKKTVQSVRIRMAYLSASDKSLGEFRQHIVRKIAPGRTVEEPTDLIGHQGPPEDVARVTVAVDEVEYTDGTHWKPAASKPAASKP
jgi:hypothetical protein